MLSGRQSQWLITMAVLSAALFTGAAPLHATAWVSPYTDPAQLTRVPFGAYSHWAQPWRAYIETIPATTFVNGTGVVLNTDNPLAIRLLAAYGIHHVRVDLGWDNVDYDNDQKVDSDQSLRLQLLAARRYGMRPLIVLYADQENPCPTRKSLRVAARTARPGATVLYLTDTHGLRAGYSGLDMRDERLPGRDGPYTAAPFPPTLAYAPYVWAAGNLITAIHGNAVTLAKPLQWKIPATTVLPFTTLKYRPFAVPGSADYMRTMGGWLRYVSTVAHFATAVLGTTWSADKGFDMEVWNELSQSPHFLFINDYYGRTVYRYDEQSIYHNLIAETAGYIARHPADFAGVLLGDGIATNIPWPASSTEPARVNAIDKHPYQRRINYPWPNSPLQAFDSSVNKQWNKVLLDAQYRQDTSPYVPSYSAFFPEYFATDLRTDTIIRDMAPIPTSIGGIEHGRYARIVHGRIIPTTVWITEVALSVKQDWPAISESLSQYDEAKIVARYLCFYLGKGATQVDLYAAVDPEAGLVDQNFLTLAAKPGAVYSPDDAQYATLALRVTARIVRAMRVALASHLAWLRPIDVLSVTDTHGHYVFRGDGTAAHPTLYDRDVFAFLPFEVNPHRFVIPYYVMTRDVMAPFSPERFTVNIKGVRGTNANVTAYDPMHDSAVPVTVVQRENTGLSVILTAADYPYLLTVQEQ